MLLRLAMAIIISAGISAGQATAQQINLSSAQVERLGIRVQPAETAKLLNLAMIPGRITAPLDARLAIAVPFGGTVLTVDVLEGAEVTAGKSLLSIASSGYLNTRAELLQHEAEYRTARASADRLRILAAEGIAAEARAEEAEANAARIEAALNSMHGRLSQTLAVTDEAGIYRLVARGPAKVATLAVKPGEYIGALETAIVLQASDRVWLEAPLSAALAVKVRPGDRVSISPGNMSGTVIAVGSDIDPKSRSVILRAEIDERGDIRPGQNVLATIFSQAPPGAITVPRGALVRLAGNDVVFAKRSGGFDVIPVTILARGRYTATIVGPLAPDRHVATSGLTELKAIAQQGI